ncbi:MAG: hypothetical protein IJN45_03205 [Alistipes sp.]|nr:hypothetical protein [Alistipes sp.]
MKKIRLAVLAAVVCTAALLTSCIKEESYEVDMAQLDVTFDTRADEEDTSVSQQQGDGIKDVMLWAFKCTLNYDGTLKTVDEDTATGWRHVQNVNANGSLTNIHLPLPICGDGTSSTASQSYVVVAVINTEQFGTTDIGGFSRATTYTQLTTGTFDASSTLFWKYRPDDEKLVPEDMPVSSWATITVTNDNTHPNKCLALTLPTYRAVAKVQLNMNKSNDNFGVVVTNVEIKSNLAPNRGCILSMSSQVPSTGDAKRLCYPNQTAGPEWWGTPSTATAEIQLANSPDIAYDDEGNITSVSSSFLPTGASYDADPTVYSPIGSAFLYENKAEPVDAGTEYDTEPTSGNGYYMAITYVFNRNYKDDNGNDLMWNGDAFNEDAEGNFEVTRYVPLPKIVRNHDYRVNATVDVVVNGKLTINYVVTDWTEKEITVPEFN